ncbi:hypothetical protein [Xylella fastidiosa]|uniref:hypothetical protein n=1 Tax=Xylella fastidiosa TaxID=2371 RepID=UPI0002DB60C8|nr:hypothetical protein [Xylella fastidiosa]MDC7963608.1 hypothetical protein [Xylella fastidiosa]
MSPNTTGGDCQSARVGADFLVLIATCGVAGGAATTLGATGWGVGAHPADNITHNPTIH